MGQVSLERAVWTWLFICPTISRSVSRRNGKMFRVTCWKASCWRASARVLTTEDVRRLLGFETKMEGQAFFKAHYVPFYTLADLEHDRNTSRKLGL